MARIMELASEMVDEAEIHQEAAVFYAFHKPMEKVAKLSGSSRPWSRLLPVVPRTGSHNGKRLKGFTTIFHSFIQQISQKAAKFRCSYDAFVL